MTTYGYFSKILNDYVKQEIKEISCRICYSNDNSEENPLFSGCNCTGSMKYIHI